MAAVDGCGAILALVLRPSFPSPPLPPSFASLALLCLLAWLSTRSCIRWVLGLCGAPLSPLPSFSGGRAPPPGSWGGVVSLKHGRSRASALRWLCGGRLRPAGHPWCSVPPPPPLFLLRPLKYKAGSLFLIVFLLGPLKCKVRWFLLIVFLLGPLKCKVRRHFLIVFLSGHLKCKVRWVLLIVFLLGRLKCQVRRHVLIVFLRIRLFKT